MLIHATRTGKKTPGGAGTHTGHTGHADAQRHTDHVPVQYTVHSKEEKTIQDPEGRNMQAES
jgi:hypothetical protein